MDSLENLKDQNESLRFMNWQLEETLQQTIKDHRNLLYKYSQLQKRYAKLLVKLHGGDVA